MQSPLLVRPLTDAERQALEAGLRSPAAFTLRRAQILLASSRGERGPAARPAPPQPARLRPSDESVDAGVGRRDGRGRRPDHDPGQRRDDSGHAGAAGHRLEAGQAPDHQPRPGVRPKKSSRDRLIRLAQTHPEWTLGFADEVWWSRVAQPAVRAWTATGQPLRLVEQTVAKHEPKAVACYGLLVRWWDDASAEPAEALWLRFVDG